MFSLWRELRGRRGLFSVDGEGPETVVVVALGDG